MAYQFDGVNMSNTTKQFSFPLNTKFRVIVNSVCFYTTKKQILAGVGDFTNFNDAMQVFLLGFEMEVGQEKARGNTMTGFVSTCRGFTIQLNVS